MESSGKFERIFLRMLKEEMTAGAGGAFGDGESMHDIKKYAEDSAIVPKMLGAVQTRKGTARKRKRKEKRKTKKVFQKKMQKRRRKQIDASVELIPFMVRRLLLTNLGQL